MKEENIMQKRLPIIEMYACLQGESKYAGRPHLLFRTTGCKLKCQFSGGSFCDTHYASWSPEKGKFTWEDVKIIFEKYPLIKFSMITGGGPTSNPQLLQELCVMAKSYGHYITIETEGSEFVQTVADNISISPKFNNSTPVLGTIKPWDNKPVVQSQINQHEKWRKNYDAMRLMIDNHSEFQIKPVISNPEDLEEVFQLIDILKLQPSDIWLMGEGLQNDQLQIRRQWLMELCILHGFNYSDRLHVIAYGDKRGV